jgi:hypothetical protein
MQEKALISTSWKVKSHFVCWRGSSMALKSADNAFLEAVKLKRFFCLVSEFKPKTCGNAE